jgi:tetratricopeptide (TPR) repeat protein
LLLARAPGNVDALRNLAFSLRALNRSHEAVTALDAALDGAPDEPRIWCERGEALEEAGAFDDALCSYRKALGIKHDFPTAVSRLLAAKTGRSEPVLVSAAHRHLAEERVSVPVKVQLHFALGRHYDCIDDCDTAMMHYTKANDIVAVGRRYRPAAAEKQTNALIDNFSASRFEQLAKIGHDSRKPIFIVGMPRSGTTLTEQVLSCHRSIAGAGELGYFMQMAFELAHEPGQEVAAFSYLDSLDSATIGPLAEKYLQQLDAVSSTMKHVTDKMPLNFLNLGLIAITFPQARIIHCWRNPLDNCFSCFIENMHQDQRYSTRLQSLGHYYLQYHDLMKHWRTTLPNRILDLCYEDLVTDFENQARRLVSFCDLEWEESCLHYYKADRAVTTPSKWQVRQPIYKTSVERWKRYQTHLGPLLEALKPLLDTGMIHGQPFEL